MSPFSPNIGAALLVALFDEVMKLIDADSRVSDAAKSLYGYLLDATSENPGYRGLDGVTVVRVPLATLRFPGTFPEADTDALEAGVKQLLDLGYLAEVPGHGFLLMPSPVPLPIL